MNKIYFVGYDAVHPADFVFDIPEGHNCYLLLITHTPAQFLIENNIVEYPAHSAILYPPHHKIWYRACKENYSNDWIRFSSNESFVTNFPQQAVPFPVSDSEYCHNLFQLLTWESALPNGDIHISQLLHLLFFKLQDDILHHEYSPYNHELLMLHKQINNNPQKKWNVPDMAKQLHISTGYLQVLYKKKFGISCVEDVIEGRLRKAKDLLIYSDYNISEIATQCGYNNPEHFCRQFRQYTGLTPGQFRTQPSTKISAPITNLRTVFKQEEE